MRNVTVTRDIAAPQQDTWAVLADFPNISDWNSGVKESHATSDAVEGVGATRHCDLAPAGALEETIAEWDPPQRMVVSIDQAAKIPIKRGLVTFTLRDGADSTPTSLRYEYEPKGGFLAKLIGPMMDRQLQKGFNGFLEDLESAAQERASA